MEKGAMEFPQRTVAEWRALVDKELAGKPFEKVLMHAVTEGVAVAPLYTELPPRVPKGENQASRAGVEGFRICMRHPADVGIEALVADVAEGADALWLARGGIPAGLFERKELANTFFVLDAQADDALPNTGPSSGRFALNALDVPSPLPGAATMVSTLPYHDAGADAADELAIALSTGVRYLHALLGAGLSPGQAARQIAVQIAVGRDTFVELCKVRALRVCWAKMLTAAGATSVPRTLVHAVCSSRTLAVRDPWVNMLRVTTQMFAAILGGADLVTPAAFDEAYGAPSAQGRRVARNTGLVLREESFLGKVNDAAAGAYYFESLTDALAREAWKRFRALERDGGIAAALESGHLAAKLEATWRGQLERIATRKMPILGVSEFANLHEVLPREVPSPEPPAPHSPHVHGPPLPSHRDAAPFEALRKRADEGAPEALLLTLGSFADSRPRVGFAAGFFAAGGIATREGTQYDGKAPVVCLCGTDDVYAADAASQARALKDAGAARVLLAGRPGALEASLRDAGVDGFIFVGCDTVGILSALLAPLAFSDGAS